MSADELQLDESWLQDYNDAMQALNHNEELIQQRQEEHKMPYEQRDNTYVLFENKFKKEGDRSPEFRGTALVDGKEKKIAGWLKKDKNGDTYLSGTLENPQDNAKRFPQQRASGFDPFKVS